MTQKDLYEIAKARYAALGIDTDAAIERLLNIPISMHCWQGDDVKGFENSGELTGGIQTTGNYPGAATTPEQLMQEPNRPKPPFPPAPPPPPQPPEPPCEEPPVRNFQHPGVGNFLQQLLPKDFDTGDLIVMLLLLLMAGDNAEDRNNAILTIALYFLM